MPLPNELIPSAVIPVAAALDFFIGDPQGLPHPIRWMGNAISRAEPLFRKLPIHTAVSGLFMAATLIAGTWTISIVILLAASKIHPVLGWTVSVLMLFYCLSIRGLYDAGIGVWHALHKKDLNRAKQKLRYIVGRDVAPLDKQGVIRATIETVAENLVDGIISPLFFALLGGPALAMTFKMVNTLDSMIAYKNETYRFFGCFAAKIDDASNWIPARLSVPVISLAARIVIGKGAGAEAWYMAMRDGRQHSSPNAGFSEAGFAGSLGLQLGGPNQYHGQLVQKPFIGNPEKQPEDRHIKQACDLMLSSALVWVLFCCCIAVVMALFL